MKAAPASVTVARATTVGGSENACTVTSKRGPSK
jgi:hypothetical protein